MNPTAVPRRILSGDADRAASINLRVIWGMTNWSPMLKKRRIARVMKRGRCRRKYLDRTIQYVFTDTFTIDYSMGGYNLLICRE
jgi:hypothetical protein